ncbi:MAG: tRNA pseudouridine(38-40) synthase TruA [Bacteroidaceae bacterium]
MNRYFITLSYDGNNYHGWQIQPNGVSVQEVLNEALSRILRITITTSGAGRTDTGVSAHMMVAHFDFADSIDSRRIVFKLNSLLPPDIAVQDIALVSPDAHARFDATYRAYRYRLTNRKNPFLRHDTWCFDFELDYEKMNEAARMLLNYTDFSSFSKGRRSVKTTTCILTEARWVQEASNLWVFHIKSDRFLRNMVRAVVGTLLEVGQGRMSMEEFQGVVESKNRRNAGVSVPGHALSLVEIGYPYSISSGQNPLTGANVPCAKSVK